MKVEKINFLGIIKKIESLYIVEAILIIVGIVLRLKLYLSNPSFFIDECSLGANIISRDYSKLFSPLNTYQCAPPFFLVVSKFILNFSHQYGNIYTQDLVLRAFPLFCSILSLPLFAIFLNKITDNKIFVWTCVAMLSLNTCAINYSVQFKQYSCELMVGLILLLIFNSFDINNLSKKTLSLYLSFFCISIWFSNTAFMILATGILYFIFKCFSSCFRSKIKSNLLKISIFFALFIINLIIYYYFYFKGIYNSIIREYMLHFWEYEFPSFFCFNNFLPSLYYKLQNLIEIPYKFVNICLFFNLIVFFFINKKLNFKVKFLVFTPILLSIIASFLHIYPFERRLILFLLPLFIMLFCQFAFLIKPNKLFKILTIIVLGILSVWKFSIPVDSIYYTDFKHTFRNIAEFIFQNQIPTNKIIYSAPIEPYYLHTYFKNNPILLKDNIIWLTFKESKTPKKLKEVSKGDYYIFTPMRDSFTDNYFFGIIRYLNNDKHLKILNTYTKNGYTYIIHIEKISDYK